MAENSKIQWTDYTGGPWLGCSEVSPGCLYCYARGLMLLWFASIVRKAYKAAGFADWETRPVWGNKAPRVLTKGFAAKARSLNKQARKDGRRYRMFPSMIDWLDDMPAGIIDQDGNQLDPIRVLGDFLNLIRETPDLDWLLLTKRPENWRKRLGQVNDSRPEGSDLRVWLTLWIGSTALQITPTPPSNVWIGASVEDQPRADERIPELLKIPAKVRFLSVEPMLGPIDFSGWFWESGCKPHCGDKCSKDADCPMEATDKIHWAIFGGESGRGARPCNIEWIRDGVKQCRAAGVAPFVKQLGATVIYSTPKMPGGVCIDLSLKDKKGGDMSEWPKDLRDVREFPV